MKIQKNKDYEKLHTPVCMDNIDNKETIVVQRHSNNFYQELSEAVDHNKSFTEMIPIFNKEMIKELKAQECCNCGKQIIGKGYVIHDTFGEVDYVLCNKECADKFQEKLR